VTVWDELKPVLLDLAQDHALTAYPDPRVDEDRHPPFSIHLASWALEQAVDLHKRFGDDITLQVGAMRYPDPAPYLRHEDLALIPELDPAEFEVTLASPVEVKSGHYVRTKLQLRASGSSTLKISTNGEVIALIVDGQTAHVVGGFTGSIRLPLVIFSVSPGEGADIPLLVDTQSFVPELGYSVPAGEWSLTAILRTIEHPLVRTPYLPVTVV
jgi:hypothetical protein